MTESGKFAVATRINEFGASACHCERAGMDLESLESIALGEIREDDLHGCSFDLPKTR